MKIKINPNCKNGEHVFIPSSNLTEGRENFVTSFVCQHCLWGVSNNDWIEHLNKIREEESELREKMEAIKRQEDENREIEKLTIEAFERDALQEAKNETTKKRGPKPKGKIEGLQID